MKTRYVYSPIFLFIFPTISTAVAESSLPTSPTVVPRAAADPSSVVSNLEVLASPKASPRGTLDAPVDGQDGKPHAGPWVETGADRDRKKAKEANIPDRNLKSNMKGSSLERVGPDGKLIPHSNDGVMDDPGRLGPKEGTRGTEGGVSEKQKGDRLTKEKVPEKPKEAPPLPQSERHKIATDGRLSGKESKNSGVSETLGLPEKPDDLPEKPHDIEMPRFSSKGDQDPLAVDATGHSSKSSVPAPSKPTSTEETVACYFHSLVFSFTMIIFSEVGDKTFLVAALMAMRHPRMAVFSAAFSALITMTVLSAVLGHAVPSLISKAFTKMLAAGLFLVFGFKMMKEGREMSADEGVGEEMKEVEMELEEKEHHVSHRRSSATPHSLESGRAGRSRGSRSKVNRLPSPPESVSSSSSREPSPAPKRGWNTVVAGLENLFSLLLSPAWVQTFAMTFLGEWGDRSQIATIAMAAGQDYWWVTIGAITGHGVCTAAAVIGGSAIAGRVSMRVVTLGGAVMFLVFGLIYLVEAII